MRCFISVLCIGALAAGCGEASPSGSGATSSTSSANSSGSGGSGGSSSWSDIDVVFNEILATGTDYIELMNTGTGVFDFSGYAIADSLDTGEPKLAEAARMPPGTSIPPGGMLLLVAEQDPAAGVGPHDVCLSTGPSSCYYSTWGVSSSNGERIFLLAADDSIVGHLEYPANVAPTGSSYGRLPDGTGDFMVTALTPGEPNQAP